MPEFPPLFSETNTPPLPFKQDNEEIEYSISQDDSDFFSRAAEEMPLHPADRRIPLTNKIFSGLMSGVINILVLIFLALLFFQGRMQPVQIDAVFSDTEGDQLDIETLDMGNIDPNPAEAYILPQPEVGDLSDFVAPERFEFDVTENSLESVAEASRVDLPNLFDGRTDPGTKNDLLSRYGGNKKTADAVKMGLLWLKKNQLKEGAWSLKGEYADGASVADNLNAATGLAILAFQGDGNTRFSGEHHQLLKRAWKWLLKQQNEDGSFFSQESFNGLFYTQAICTIAICELVAMEKREGKGSDLLGDAQRAVDYLVDRQNRSLGGWRYHLKEGGEARISNGRDRTLVVTEEAEDSDLSVTGWCTMALMSARVAGLNVPDETFERLEHFLDLVAAGGGSEYSYTIQSQPTPSMTATGLLCREYLGWNRNTVHLLQGAETLVTPENLIHYPDADKRSLTNVYGWYSASMMLKHLGANNPFWKKWNKALCKEIPEHQEPEKSREGGSWDPKADLYTSTGGRLYVTCLSILCLEVYYRHLSLYE